MKNGASAPRKAPDFLASSMNMQGSKLEADGNRDLIHYAIEPRQPDTNRGFTITQRGKVFLGIDGPVEADVARFLSSFQSDASLTQSTVKSNWDLVVRVCRDSQSKRIRDKVDDLIRFCLDAHLIE